LLAGGLKKSNGHTQQNNTPHESFQETFL